MKKLIASLLRSAAGKMIVELLLTLFFKWLRSEGYYVCSAEHHIVLTGGQREKAIIKDFCLTQLDNVKP